MNPGDPTFELSVGWRLRALVPFLHLFFFETKRAMSLTLLSPSSLPTEACHIRVGDRFQARLSAAGQDVSAHLSVITSRAARQPARRPLSFTSRAPPLLLSASFSLFSLVTGLYAVL